MSNSKGMSSNAPNSFFVPQTPTPIKNDKAMWEINDDVKATAFYKALMDDSDSDSDVVVLTEAEKQMFINDQARYLNLKRRIDWLQ